MGLGMGFPGTGNIGPKTAGNREHRPQNSREQGTFIKNSGTREHAAGTTEHWLENGREHGTMALKAPGTGNIDLKTAGTREHRTPFFLFLEVISEERKYYGLKAAGSREQTSYPYFFLFF